MCWLYVERLITGWFQAGGYWIDEGIEFMLWSLPEGQDQAQFAQVKTVYEKNRKSYELYMLQMILTKVS